MIVLPTNVDGPLNVAIKLDRIFKQICVEVRFAIPWVVEGGRVTAIDGAVSQERPESLLVEPLPVIESVNAVTVRSIKLQLIPLVFNGVFFRL